MIELESKLLCPHCGEQLHQRPYLMAVNPDAPGLLALLRGEGKDRLLSLIARAAVMLGWFVVALLLIWALRMTL